MEGNTILQASTRYLGRIRLPRATVLSKLAASLGETDSVLLHNCPPPGKHQTKSIPQAVKHYVKSPFEPDQGLPASSACPQPCQCTQDKHPLTSTQHPVTFREDFHVPDNMRAPPPAPNPPNAHAGRTSILLLKVLRDSWQQGSRASNLTCSHTRPLPTKCGIRRQVLLTPCCRM